MSRAGPGNFAALATVIARKKTREETVLPHRPTISYAWESAGGCPRKKPKQRRAKPPTAIKDKEFWKGSAFGVRRGARSFPGIIAITPTPTIFFNFREGDRSAKPDRGSRRPIGPVSSSLFSIRDLNVVAIPTGPYRTAGKEPLVLKARGERQLFSQIVERDGGEKIYLSGATCRTG